MTTTLGEGVMVRRCMIGALIVALVGANVRTWQLWREAERDAADWQEISNGHKAKLRQTQQRVDELLAVRA